MNLKLLAFSFLFSGSAFGMNFNYYLTMIGLGQSSAPNPEAITKADNPEMSLDEINTYIDGIRTGLTESNPETKTLPFFNPEGGSLTLYFSRLQDLLTRTDFEDISATLQTMKKLQKIILIADVSPNRSIKTNLETLLQSLPPSVPLKLSIKDQAEMEDKTEYLAAIATKGISIAELEVSFIHGSLCKKAWIESIATNCTALTSLTFVNCCFLKEGEALLMQATERLIHLKRIELFSCKNSIYLDNSVTLFNRKHTEVGHAMTV